jgi:ABC-2 type transport system permease protein
MKRSIAHARWEVGLLLTNGEQVLLSLIIPTGLVLLLRDLAPVAAASVIATMFTSLAIGTGFERRSGALRFLGTTPLTRVQLLVGKLLAQGVVLGLSLVLAFIAAAFIGVLPDLEPAGALVWVVAIVLASWAFAAWALALAGWIRAEATLAVANALFLVLIATAIPDPDELSSPLRELVLALPSGALSQALRHPEHSLIAFGVLIVWGVLGTVFAARRFRWS